MCVGEDAKERNSLKCERQKRFHYMREGDKKEIGYPQH